jgi:hypothetical protein
MNDTNRRSESENVFHALVALFFLGPVLALVGLYTSPKIAMGAFFIQIFACAAYFLVKVVLPGFISRMSGVAKAKASSVANVVKSESAGLASPHAAV